jgi:hypothetical protein
MQEPTTGNHLLSGCIIDGVARFLFNAFIVRKQNAKGVRYATGRMFEAVIGG